MIDSLEKRILEEDYAISFEEAVELTKTDHVERLCDAADRIRSRFCGEEFDTCSIVNARSGKCSEDCKWCAQSAYHDTGIVEYERKPHEEVLKAARANDAKGIRRFSLVTSGRRVDTSEMEKFCDAYREVRQRTGIRLCASMGLIGEREMRMLKEAGVERYECNLETASSFFDSLCTTHTSEQKKETLWLAKRMGMEICSGGIIGMGETMEQRVELAFELRELGVRSVPINILNPIPGTALAKRPPLGDDEILHTVAVFRFVLPDAFIRFAGGRVRLSRELQKRLLRSGVNASLVGDLLTTAGTDIDRDYELFSEAGYRLQA